VTVHVAGQNAKLPIEQARLRLLFVNLIENAIKYNRPGGSVTVEVKKRGGTVSISVADTGIGIPEEHQSRVFERFYRVDKSRSKKTGGTGLGLAIVKHVTALYGGSLNLVSAPGKGTTITIAFPVAEGRQKASRQSKEAG
jgi:two-component system phosphate regulon sensor histidine kinase PhoR